MRHSSCDALPNLSRARFPSACIESPWIIACAHTVLIDAEYIKDTDCASPSPPYTAPVTAENIPVHVRRIGGFRPRRTAPRRHGDRTKARLCGARSLAVNPQTLPRRKSRVCVRGGGFVHGKRLLNTRSRQSQYCLKHRGYSPPRDCISGSMCAGCVCVAVCMCVGTCYAGTCETARERI